MEVTLEFVQTLILKARNHIKITLLLTLVLIMGLNIYGEVSVRPIYDKQLLIGHRGGEYGAENTIDTIIFTGTNGADYVEMDVLLTKDNVPVVIHDNNLKRLGNISKNISDLTLEKEGILEETIFQSSEENIISEFNGKYEELSIGYVFIGKLGAFSARKMSKMPIDFISAE